jgi:GYD domain
MPLYMVEYSYTAEAWRALIAGEVEGQRIQRDRQQAVEELVANLGGRFPRLVFDGSPDLPDIKCKKFTFGEHDVVALIHFPDTEAAAAFAMLISSTGAVKSFKTTPLMTMDEGIRAMERAHTAQQRTKLYTPPHKPQH